MPRTREQDREYQRKRRERLAREKANPAAQFKLTAVPPIVPAVVESGSRNAEQAAAGKFSMVAAVDAQLALIPAESLALQPALAGLMTAAALILDDPELRHLHAQNMRELRTSFEKLTELAPAARPESKLQSMRGRRGA